MSTEKIPISQILDTFADEGVKRIVPKDFRDFVVSSIGNLPIGEHYHSNTLGIDEVFVSATMTATDSYLELPPCGGTIYEDIPTKGKFYLIMNDGLIPFNVKTTLGDFFQDGSIEIELTQNQSIIVVAKATKWIVIPVSGAFMGGDGGTALPEDTITYPNDSTALIPIFDPTKYISCTIRVVIESLGRVNSYDITAHCVDTEVGYDVTQIIGSVQIDDIELSCELHGGFLSLRVDVGSTGTMDNKITYRVSGLTKR